MISLSELALTTRLKFGDKRAFEQLIRQHQSAVRRFFLHLTTGNQMLADDLSQDTFIKAFRSMEQFKGNAAFRTWLFRIAYNVWYDYHRRQNINEDTLDNVQIESKSAPDVGLQMDIAQAMRLLKPIERTCITLQIIEGQKTEEIAKITELNANTVRSHISRGKQRLAEYLKLNGYG